MYKLILAVLGFSAAILDASAANELSIYVFPRENRDALEVAYFKPFREATGADLKDGVYDGTDDRFTRMLKSGKARWELMQVESRMLERGCREGWLEKIDQSKVVKADFVPGSISECGVGIFAWSHALVYNADKVVGTPSSWSDFWDLKKFPGKRGLRRSAKYTLEIALLADGVAPADVYKVLGTRQGVDRAFRKLEQIKPDVVWWQAAAQPTLFLAADKIVMSSAYTLWVATDQKAGTNFRIVWNGSLHDFDSWAIPKGATQIENAYKFIAFASRPENQKLLSTELAYGPTNKKALSLLEPRVANTLPTAEANLKGAITIDMAFWGRHGVELEHRFADWAPALEASADEQEEEHHGKKAKPAHAH